MLMKLNNLVAGLVLSAGLVCGCSKSEKGGAQSLTPAPASSGDAVSRIHWVGKKAVLVDPLGTNFATIWKMAETYRMETQTVDRVASIPWKFLRGEGQATNAAIEWLRPLIQDIVEHESYTEFRKSTHSFPDLAFAIRLDEAHAKLWETNLSAVMESLTGIQPAPAPDGKVWSLRQKPAPDTIELARAGEWTVVGMGQSSNPLFRQMLAQVEKGKSPYRKAASKLWLEANVDLVELAEVFSPGRGLTGNIPRLAFEFKGEGATVHTRAELTFPQALGIQLDPWNVPTNLIGYDVLGFSAVRGIRPWLAASKWWNDLQLGTPPNQMYCWTFFGATMETYAAVPLAKGSTQVDVLAQQLIEKGNPWLQTNRGMGELRTPQGGGGVNWYDIPFASPFLRVSSVGNPSFAVSGFMPILETYTPPPAVINQLFAQTNLVCFDWEIVGPRIRCWFEGLQLARMAAGKSQLSASSPAGGWVASLIPILGNYVGVTTLPQPNKLLVINRSEVGLTSLQMYLMADWLESPDFPYGFYASLPGFGEAGSP